MEDLSDLSDESDLSDLSDQSDQSDLSDWSSRPTVLPSKPSEAPSPFFRHFLLRGSTVLPSIGFSSRFS